MLAMSVERFCCVKVFLINDRPSSAGFCAMGEMCMM